MTKPTTREQDWNPERLRFFKLGDWQGGGTVDGYERPATQHKSAAANDNNNHREAAA